MNWYKFSLMPFIAATIVLGCGRYTIDIHKRKAEAPSREQITEPSKLLLDIRALQTPNDYLKHLNELRSAGAGTFFKLYKVKGRSYMREGLRYFRDSVLNQAVPETIKQELFTADCSEIELNKAFDIGGYGDIRQLLDTAFLVTLRKNQTADFDPSMPEKMDELYQLVFFELGINMKGHSSYEKSAIGSKMSSEVNWRVVHEVGDPEEQEARDNLETQFRFSRTEKSGISDSFEIEARVLKAKAEGLEGVPEPALALEYQILNETSGAISQSLTLTQGQRRVDGIWQNKTLSRRLVFATASARSRAWTLNEYQRFGLAGELRRRLTRDKDNLDLCRVESWGEESSAWVGKTH